MQKRKLIVIGGPTASGKTSAAIRLCQKIGGEVISADSMQVYRGMDIGTAKPTEAEMGGIPHHMLNILDPGEGFSASNYRERAMEAIERVETAAGKRPVVCGGTGLYIDALTRPMGFGEQAGDEHIRQELHALEAEEGGRERLHKMLEAVDPESAARLHANDVRRVIRALEVYRLTGRTIGEQARADRLREGPFEVTMFALLWPREMMYERINRRVDEMMAQGLQEEVIRLMHAGLPEGSTAMQALGYKEIVAALHGEISMETAVEAIKRGSRNYAKRQMTWFRRDERTRWINAPGRSLEQIVDEMIQNLSL